MAIQISRNQLGSPRPAAQRDLYRDLIVSILIFGLYFLPAQAQATQEESVEFTMIPEPEGGKTIAYPLDTVIQDAERWADFWNDLHPGKPVPAIDFERRMVIATALGGGTATSAIKVTSVTRKSVPDLAPLIKVYIKEIRPGRGCIITAIFMPPPHVLVETETGHDVTFRRRSQYRHCD
jgi:hypothetical protein